MTYLVNVKVIVTPQEIVVQNIFNAIGPRLMAMEVMIRKCFEFEMGMHTFLF